MSILKTQLILVASLIVMSLHGQSDTPIITDRPSQSFGSYIIPAKVFQLETGLGYTELGLSNQPLNEEHLYYWNTLWRLGLGAGFEFRAVTQTNTGFNQIADSIKNSINGMSDLQIGLKKGLFSGDKSQATLMVHYSAPTGSNQLNKGKHGLINRFIYTYQISESHSLTTNLGYDLFEGGDSETIYTLAWVVALSGKLSVFIENYGNLPNGNDSRIGADAGFTYLLARNLQLDYVFGTGLNFQTNFHSIGLSWRLNPPNS